MFPVFPEAQRVAHTHHVNLITQTAHISQLIIFHQSGAFISLFNCQFELGQKHIFICSEIQFSPNAKGKHLWDRNVIADWALMCFRALTFLQVY